MLYVHYEKPGPAEGLVLVEGKVPEIASEEVLIEVHAAGINYPDIIQRKGLYPPPAGASPILGLEVSGRIVGLGEAVTQWKIGDEVCALTNGGGYAQYVAVPHGQCLPIPEGVSLSDAASLPEVYFTVWHNVFKLGQLKEGQYFLVHGGSGGIGSCAIQLAKAFGAKVLTTCGSDQHCAYAMQLGADIAINYTTHDFVEEVIQYTQDQGVHVILDHIAGEYFPRNMKLLQRHGRLVEIAALTGREVRMDIFEVLFKSLTITGSALRPMSSFEKAQIATDLTNNVWPLFATQKIKPVVAKCFAFEDVVKAHQYMESKHTGKVILEMSC